MRTADAREDLEVVAVGESMALVAPAAPEPIEEARAFTLGVGGAESNVAMYLAGLGHRVGWVSRLGDDPLGRRVLHEVRAAGVDTAEVVLDADARTGVYFKDTTAHGTHVHYYRDGSAASRMTAEVLSRPRLADVPLVHLSGITAALSDACRGLLRAAVVDRALGRSTVSFDVNYRPGLWPGDEAASVLAELADASDLVLVGLDEAHELWGCETADDVRDLLPRPATVVVKDAGVAAHHLGAQERISIPAPRVEVVEPVGAGDAFAAGYLSAMLHGAAPRRRLRLGHLVAAHALGVTGDHTPLPDRAWFEPHLEASDDAWSQLRLTTPDGAT